MRIETSCQAASPSNHVSKKWLVMGTFGLFAMGLCFSSHAAVKKTDPSSPTISKKSKKRKVSAKTGKTQNLDPEWQKKQPFASITHQRKKHVSASPARQARQNDVDYRLVSRYLPASGRSGANERNVIPASSVLTGNGNALPYAYSSGKAPIFAREAKESGTGNAVNNGYTLGSTRFSMNYEKSADTTARVSRYMSGKATPDMATNNDIVETRQNQPNIQLGMEYATGNGRVNASVNYVRLKDMKGASSATAGTNNNDSTDLKTFAIGYTYDVSDRTSFYGMVAHTDYEKEAITGYMRGNGFNEDSVTGVQFGMTHKF